MTTLAVVCITIVATFLTQFVMLIILMALALGADTAPPPRPGGFE